MRQLIILAVLLSFIVGNAQAAPLSQNKSPAIIDFSTAVTVVNRATLRQRLVRLPVTWQAINRPLTANLVFEPVLPDGSAINVELPRLFPWVSSSGAGIAAPIEPPTGVNEIVLRVVLRDVFSQRVYSERRITLPIGNTGDPGSDAGFVPTITRFTASTTTIPRHELLDGTARIGVTWQTINRPVTTTLVFEQVLAPDNRINVELPRPNPWVNTSGNGVVAPINPGNRSDQVWLRLRFLDRLNGRVHDQRDLFITIVDRPQPAIIQSFITGVTSVDAQRLQQGNERTPVNWAVLNRPPNSNLVFEQIFTSGTVVNVELPRPNPLVPDSGLGMLNPRWPGDNATQVRFQLRLIDLGSGAIYDRAEIVLPIIGQPQPDFFITHFSSVAPNVNMGRILSGMERVSVTWALNQRPPNTNMVFEQRLLNGALRNIELPRPNLLVPARGSGVVAPVWPGDQAQFVVLVMRLINLNTNATLDSAELTLPIVGTEGSGVQYSAACFGSPYGPNRGFQVGDQARVAMGDAANGLRVRNLPQGDFVETMALGTTFDIIEGPACWTIQTVAPGQSDFRVWRIRTHQHNLEAWVEEYRFVIDGGRFEYYIEEIPGDVDQVPIINSFSANPTTAQPGGAVALAWNVAQASTTAIQVSGGNGQINQVYANQPLVGTLNYAVPADSPSQLSFVLSAYSPNRTQVQSQSLTVRVTCPHRDTLISGECPLTQVTSEAAFQTFENGSMVWRGDTRQIYVLYNDGSYDTFADNWTPDQPVDSGETPPAGLILPARGFGKVWVNEPGIRNRVGWATNNESSFSTKLESYSAPGQANVVVLNISDGRTLVIGVTWQAR